MAGANAEKGAEGGVPGAAAVEAEDELIKIGLKVLAARACARPLIAPSTMTPPERTNHARCAINCRIHRSLWSEHGRIRQRVTVPPLYLLTPW